MSKNPHIPWPPPGTSEAISQGCTCPVEDNKHGVGVPLGHSVAYWCNTDCIIHGKVAKQKIKKG